jgi:hypothetical protein
LIELAYREAEAAGGPRWCQDAAGPYPAIPQPGASWQPTGQPVGRPQRQPHEYVRGGTAKRLTLFRPATGEVRARGVTNAPNAVLHPWLQAELTQVLAALPAVTPPAAERPPAAQWATWLGHAPRAPRPPLRRILIWDNLAGHLSWAIVQWLFQHGVMPLYPPLSGSWLNLAEAVQRILAGRALAGAGRAASAERSGGHHVAGGDSGRLERAADALRLGRQAPGAARPGLPAPPRGCCGRRRQSPVACGMTH